MPFGSWQFHCAVVAERRMVPLTSDEPMGARSDVSEVEDPNGWLAVIGRSLALLCLTQADLRDKGLGPQAHFLEGLGLRRKDAAALLGTTATSITQTFSHEQTGKKRTRRGSKKG